MKHEHNGQLLAVSGSIPGATVIVAGTMAETQAEMILADIPTTETILWCTPPHGSVTGKRLIRRLFNDGPTLEWGPPLVIMDRPGLEVVIYALARELGDA